MWYDSKSCAPGAVSYAASPRAAPRFSFGFAGGAAAVASPGAASFARASNALIFAIIADTGFGAVSVRSNRGGATTLPASSAASRASDGPASADLPASGLTARARARAPADAEP